MLALGIQMAKHGEPHKDNYNAWSTLIAVIIEVSILWWGGFWDGLL